jgi:hypothetical protein
MNQSCGEDRNSRIGDVVEDGVFGFATFIQVASWRRSSDDTLLASAVLLQNIRPYLHVRLSTSGVLFSWIR